jgi:hypothetical protein
MHPHRPRIAHTVTATVNIELIPRQFGYEVCLRSQELELDGVTALDGEALLDVLGPDINLASTRQLQVTCVIDLPGSLLDCIGGDGGHAAG